MGAALTEASTVKCAHAGSVQLSAGQSKLTVNGNKVLVDGDLTGASINTCSTPITSSSSPCQSATPLPGGVAAKLKVDGKGVLLEDIKGLTDGVGAPPNWSVESAGQTRLQTV